MVVGVMASIGEGNVGDEAILDGVLERLSNRKDLKKVVVFSHHPKESREWHKKRGVELKFVQMLPTGFRSVYRSIKTGQWKKIYRAIKSLDAVVIGGGGIFYDTESRVGTNPLLVWFLRVLLLRQFRMKIVIHSVGVGPIRKGMSRFYMREMCRMVDEISVRDKASKNLLKRIRIEDVGRVKVVPDPAWDLNLKSGANVKKAVFIVRECYGVKGWKDRACEVLAQLASWCEKERGLKVEFLPFSVRDPDDRKFIADILKKTARGASKMVIPGDKVGAWYKEVATAELCLSMRLHGQIFALKAGVPLVALSYSSKTESLMKEYVSGFDFHDVKNLDLEILKKAILKAKKGRVKDLSNQVGVLD